MLLLLSSFSCSLYFFVSLQMDLMVAIYSMSSYYPLPLHFNSHISLCSPSTTSINLYLRIYNGSSILSIQHKISMLILIYLISCPLFYTMYLLHKMVLIKIYIILLLSIVYFILSVSISLICSLSENIYSCYIFTTNSFSLFRVSM
jgi:hypothetical protein